MQVLLRLPTLANSPEMNGEQGGLKKEPRPNCGTRGVLQDGSSSALGGSHPPGGQSEIAEEGCLADNVRTQREAGEHRKSVVELQG